METNGNPATRLINASINMRAFDVIGFQECEDPDWLSAHSGMHGTYTIYKNRDCCMAYMTHNWKLLERGVEYPTMDQWGKRAAQWMRLQHKATGRLLFFVNYHGPIPINTGGLCGSRSCAWVIMDMIHRNAHDGDAIVLVGDFNAGIHSEMHKLVTLRMHQAFAGTVGGGIDWMYTNLPSSAVLSHAKLGKGGSDHDALGMLLQISGQGKGVVPKLTPDDVDDNPEVVEKPSEESKGSKHAPAEECPSGAPIERGFFYNVPEGTGRLHYDDVEIPKDCCARCHHVERCKAWSWEIDGDETHCWLWGVTPKTKVQKDDCASGFPHPGPHPHVVNAQ